MTVEIAILNKTAVALATDSAVTVGDKRIFNACDKLFMLSKVHPIGVMIYQNIALMGVPLETIIKNYRQELGARKFDTIKQCAEHFIGFMQNNRLLFPEEMQLDAFARKVSILFNGIIDSAYEKAKKEEEEIKTKEKASAGDDQAALRATNILEKSLSSEIERNHRQLSGLPIRDCFKDLDIDDVAKTHHSKILELIRKSFEKFELTPENTQKLTAMALDLFLRSGLTSFTGLVIAGFGDKEIFPSVIHYLIEDIFDNRVKFTFIEHCSLNHGDSANMLTFAQRDFISTFLNGIDPKMRAYVRGELPRAFNSVKEAILTRIADLPPERKKEIGSEIDRTITGELEKYYRGIEDYECQKFIIPMGNFISALSKSELASMAETFVQLTSFKVKITSDLESVGGPIDVAVISKGDGFVWVKRKHYFDVKYNPHFVENYMTIKEASDDA